MIYRKTARSITRLGTLYRVNLRVRWCWGPSYQVDPPAPNINEFSSICFLSDIDPVAIQVHSPCAVQDQPRSWNGGSHGSHYTVAQATLANCLPAIPWLGCWWRAHHTLEFWAFGNGTWRAAGGDRRL